MKPATMPSWFFTSIGVAVSVQIGLTALALAGGSAVPLVVGLAIFAATAGAQLMRFHRAGDGLRITSFVGRMVLGTGVAPSSAYAVALAAAAWAGFADRWWLVVLWSAAGGGAYAAFGRRQMLRLRGDPADAIRTTILCWLALSAAAVGGLTILALGS